MAKEFLGGGQKTQVANPSPLLDQPSGVITHAKPDPTLKPDALQHIKDGKKRP